MKADPERIAAARAVIDNMLTKHKRLDFKMLEGEIRAVIGDPGASYEDVVEFFAACGLMVKLNSVHRFCIPRNIRPPLRTPASPSTEPAPAITPQVVRRRTSR